MSDTPLARAIRLLKCFRQMQHGVSVGEGHDDKCNIVLEEYDDVCEDARKLIEEVEGTDQEIPF